MAIGNIDSVSSMLARMTPQQRQQFAVMHKDDPIMVSLAKFVNDVEQEKAQAMRNQQLMQRGPMPTVVDQEVMAMAPPQAQPMLPEEVGIGALPAPNMEHMAGGGITGEDEVERYAEEGLVSPLQQIGAQIEQVDQFLQAAQRSRDPAAISYYQDAKQKLVAQLEQTARELNLTTIAPVEGPRALREAKKTPAAPAPTPTPTQPTPAPASVAAAPTPAPARAPARAPAAPTPEKAPVGIAALTPMQRAEQYLPSQDKAMREYEERETLAANTELARLKEMLGADKSKAYEGLESRIKEQETAATGKLSEEKAMAIIQAGLAIMGGTSPHAAANIGAGALKGLEGYKEARKELDRAAREREKMLADIEQARRAEMRDDNKTLMMLTQRIEDRKEKVRDSVFAAGQNLGLKKGEMAAGFEKLEIQQAGEDRRARMQAAAMNRTPAEIQMVERMQRDPAFAAAYEKYVGVKREPLTREKAMVEWMKPGAAAMIQAQFPNIKTFDDYWRAVSGGATGAGGAGLSATDQALINKYSR